MLGRQPRDPDAPLPGAHPAIWIWAGLMLVVVVGFGLWWWW